MSNSQIDADGFQVVSKRFSRKKPTKVPQKDHQISNSDIKIDITRALQRIQTTVEDLRLSSFLKEVLQSVSTVITSRSVLEFVCFGLGHVGECQISRHQLALLLCLKESLNPQKVFVHDPIFYKDECTLLKQLNLDVIERNSEGSYRVTDEGITVLYFPHCPKQLTNNFLWSNWGTNLQNCVLICNSFTTLFDSQPYRIISQSVPYIHKIYPYITEIPLENSFKYTDIFNDTSIHIFPKEKLVPLDSEFWTKTDKPDYQDTEEFITSQMIEKLTI